MNKPQTKIEFGKYSFTWPDLEACVEIDHLSTEGRGRLRFYHANGNGKHLLHMTEANLLTTSTMAGIVKLLEKKSAIDWTTMLTQVTAISLEAVTSGEPTDELWPSENDCTEVEYLLNPLLYLGHPTVLFGDYGSLKSWMALVIAYVAQLPYEDNKLGITTRKEPTTCLYLDYEDDTSSFRQRWSTLSLGFGKAAMPILYRRMTTPLADSVEGIQQIIKDKSAKLMIVDSLGPAVRGNLNDPEPAIRYNAALRQIGLTSLTLAHTAKDQFTKKRSIFGSIFFSNMARSVWECKSEHEAGEDEVIVSLKQTKANLSRLHLPLGYKFVFSPNRTIVTAAELKDTDLSGELPIGIQIQNLLRRGPLSANDIASKLEKRPDSIGKQLSRMCSNNKVIKLEDNTWGLEL